MKVMTRFACCVAAVVLLACGEKTAPVGDASGHAGGPGAGMDEVAVISTPHGDITIRFFPDLAPGHVENFKKLAREGFYDGTIFHRVIPGFMIQGGDPNTKDLNAVQSYGMGGPGYQIRAEFSSRSHKRGIVSMARSQNPNSAGSQFFICVADSPFLDGQYTVFGEVVSGMDVADRIVAEPRNQSDLPHKRMEMKVRLTPAPAGNP